MLAVKCYGDALSLSSACEDDVKTCRVIAIVITIVITRVITIVIAIVITIVMSSACEGGRMMSIY